MGTKDDLIAAKALVDTPEKFAAFGSSTLHALYQATGDWESYADAERALARHRMRGFGFQSAMEQFDRAIEAAE